MNLDCQRAIYDARRRLTTLERDLANQIGDISRQLAELKPKIKDNFDPSIHFKLGFLRGQLDILHSAHKELKIALRHVGNWDHDNFKVKTNLPALALSGSLMPVIRGDKIEEFLEESKKHKVPEEVLERGRMFHELLKKNEQR